MTDSRFDVLVIGAGIAGASFAARLASEGVSLALLEGEVTPGYHTTGRSAAFFNPNHGPRLIRELAKGSYTFLAHPPGDFADHSLVSPRGILAVATSEQVTAFESFIRGDDEVRRVAAQEAVERVPILRGDRIARAAISPAALDIDVHALHDGFLRMARREGGALVCNALVSSLCRRDGLWHLSTKRGTFTAPAIVNAAGAWAGEVARLAGALDVGLEPRRRTALIVDLPAGVEPDAWPLVVDAVESFYFKPDAGKLMLSPSDAVPSPPTDARPEEIDVAIAVDRFEHAVNFTVDRIGHRWAGLRTFAPDDCPVIGWDPRVHGFFWLAGQGGSGIQSAPLASEVARSLYFDQSLPREALVRGIDARALAPQRFVQ